MKLTKKQTKFINALHDPDTKIMALHGAAGTGKSQKVTEPIQTPTGEIPIGNIHVGDYVIDKNGLPTKVIGVYPQGELQSYKITFRDKSYTYCSKDHLWAVWTQKLRCTHKPCIIKTLEELMKKGIIDNSNNYRYCIPLCSPIQYPIRKYIIHPYVLGAFIGGGTNLGVSPTLSTPYFDKEIISIIKQYIPNYINIHKGNTGSCDRYTFSDPNTHNSNRMAQEFKKLRLNINSGSRFIPKEYLLGSVQQRLLLLQGLMDTDGCSARNRIRFSTKSSKLAEDIVYLVQSLGGTAILKRKDRLHQDKGIEYSVNVKMFMNPFILSRKANEWSFSKKNPPSRYIVSIEPDEVAPHVCISIEAEDNLYLTRDFIVTHNTVTTVEGVKNIISSVMLNENSKVNSGIFLLYPSHMARNVFLDKLEVDVVKESFTDKTTTTIIKDECEINAVTIHAFLGMRPDHESKVDDIFDDNFKIIERLQAAQLKKLSIYSFLYIFVDEISMISEQMMKSLIKLLQRSEIEYKLCLVGDYNQIPPVNAKSSDTYVADIADNIIELDTIFRTDSSSITECANKLLKDCELPESKGDVSVLSPVNFDKKYVELIKKTNKSKAMTIYIGYRNINVASAEDKAMKALGRENSYDYKKKDIVRVHQSITTGADIFCFNGELVSITSITEKELDLPWIEGTIPITLLGLTKDFIKVHVVGAASLEELRNRKNLVPTLLSTLLNSCKEIDAVLQKNSTESYKTLISGCSEFTQVILTQDASNPELSMASTVRHYFKNEQESIAKRKTRALVWRRGFFSIRDLFIPISTRYALTAHKAQGQEYDNVFLDYPDLKHASKKQETHKLLYVAASRAKKMLFIKGYNNA